MSRTGAWTRRCMYSAPFGEQEVHDCPAGKKSLRREQLMRTGHENKSRKQRTRWLEASSEYWIGHAVVCMHLCSITVLHAMATCLQLTLNGSCMYRWAHTRHLYAMDPALRCQIQDLWDPGNFLQTVAPSVSQNVALSFWKVYLNSGRLWKCPNLAERFWVYPLRNRFLSPANVLQKGMASC